MAVIGPQHIQPIGVAIPIDTIHGAHHWLPLYMAQVPALPTWVLFTIAARGSHHTWPSEKYFLSRQPFNMVARSSDHAQPTEWLLLPG